MSDCCTPSGYDKVFNARCARRSLKHHRRKGLDSLEQTVVAGLTKGVGSDSTLLEVGGGLGHLQLAILGAGAGHATNVELSPAYEEAAVALAATEGFADRIDRHLGDFVIVQDDIPSADLVVMNRVVCCYPHMERLVGAAAAKANRRLALIFPRDEWWTRTFLAFGNFFARFSSNEFRVFVHSPDDISSVVGAAGLSEVVSEENRFWRAVVYERAA